MKLRKITTNAIGLIMAFVFPYLLGGCGAVRSHWGVEGDLPFGDSHYYYEQDHQKKHKKHKKRKKHHHDDDSAYDTEEQETDPGPYNEFIDVPI